MYQALRIFEAAPAVTLVSGRIHPRKPWMLKKPICYRGRIEKKWAKRYGPISYKPTMYQMGDILFVHPSLMPQIRALAK
jgi:hypothetical protein